MSYGLYRDMEMFEPHRATAEEMAQYHSLDYIQYIKQSSEARDQTGSLNHEKFNLLENGDCPLFPGIYEFCQISCGGSIDCAIRLNHKLNDTCINWAGGLHHARKKEANGFCYTNDIVLGILELLKFHKRVLYIDIDIHHGDGVEEAFYFTDRVFTCSFHRYGEDFFPGTGAITDFGEREGKFCCCNFPLKDGLLDDDFLDIFCPIIDKIMERYQPEVIVLQCGADSLIGDRLGCFSLSIRGHAAAVAHVRNYRLPLMILGGGGYTVSNVARCWAYETALLTHIHSNVISKYDPYAVNVSQKEQKERNSGRYGSKLKITKMSKMYTYNDILPFDIPKEDDYYACYAPNYNLELKQKFVPINGNSENVLRKYKRQVLQNLDRLKGPPSVQFSNRSISEFEQERLDIMERSGEIDEEISSGSREK